jgi:Na+/H+ antiporter NhaC
VKTEKGEVKMNLRTVGIILLVGGVLLFFFAVSQMQGQGAAAFLPLAVNQQIAARDQQWRLVQILGGLAAIVGGVMIFIKKPTS